MIKHQAFVHRNLPLLLLQAREAVMQHRRPTLRAHGLSDQQWRVLRVLAEPAHTDGLETGRLAHEAHLLGPSLTGMLGRMEAAGLLQRARSPEDARRSVVSATREGLALAAVLRATIEGQYLELEVHMGQPKLAQLYALLDDLIALHPTEDGDVGAADDGAQPAHLTEADA